MARGLPKVSTIFKKIADLTATQRRSGIAALILIDSSVTELTHSIIEDDTETPSTLSADNKAYISQALRGIPDELKVVIIPPPVDPEPLDITEALDYLEMTKFNVVAVPGQVTSIQTALSEWIKTLRTDRGKKVMGIVANVASDHEGIINFTTTDIETQNGVYTAEDFTARIAGLIAGLSLDMAPTYQVLSDVISLPIVSRATLNGKVDSGELVLFHDGEKVKVGRGVTSLTTLGEDTSPGWQKIKLTRIYDKLDTDVRGTISDSYIGQVGNSYPNKIMLVEAINTYLKTLEQGELLYPNSNKCDIDVEAQKTYLKQIGYTTDDGRTPTNMTDQEIREAKTEDKLFLKLKAMGLDAMEDADIRIYV